MWAATCWGIQPVDYGWVVEQVIKVLVEDTLVFRSLRLLPGFQVLDWWANSIGEPLEKGLAGRLLDVRGHNSAVVMQRDSSSSDTSIISSNCEPTSTNDGGSGLFN